MVFVQAQLAYTRSPNSHGYLGRKTTGEAIDQGSQHIVFAILLGMVPEISFNLKRREQPEALRKDVSLQC